MLYEKDFFCQNSFPEGIDLLKYGNNAGMKIRKALPYYTQWWKRRQENYSTFAAGLAEPVGQIGQLPDQYFRLSLLLFILLLPHPQQKWVGK